MIDKTLWLCQFDDTKEMFHWFFIKYGYDYDWNRLLEARKKNQVKKMVSIMEQVWYELPDTIFNIKENPKGWNEFLNLLEQ